MDYSGDDEQFARWVRQQVALVQGRIPIYPGIGASASTPALLVDGVVGQIRRARELGASGFCIFNFDRATAAAIVPGVGLGIGKQRAVTPHTETHRGGTENTEKNTD